MQAALKYGDCQEEEENIPEEWCKGVIWKLPKRRNLSNCEIWWGITLLSVPGRVLGRVIISRSGYLLDENLHKELAGFPPCRVEFALT